MRFNTRYIKRFKNNSFEILDLIVKHKALTYYQICYYMEEVYGLKKLSSRQRIRRYRVSNFIQGKTYGNNPERVFFQITEAGIELLKKSGLYSVDYKEDSVPIITRGDHFWAIRDVSLMTRMRFKPFQENIVPDFSCSLVYDKVSNDKLYPDCVISNREKGTKVFIEVDTGTEKSEAIEEKVNKYIKYALQHPSENLNLLFVVMDDNLNHILRYTNKYGNDRRKRIANIKQWSLNTNAQSVNNLNIYVVSLSRAAIIAEKLLSGEYPMLKESKFNNVNLCMTQLSINERFPYQIYNKEENLFYFSDVKKELYADGHFYFRHPTKEKMIIVKLLEEGSIKDLDSIQYLNTLQQEKLFRQHVDEVWGLYMFHGQMENDVFGERLENVYLVNSAEWFENVFDIPMARVMENSVRLKEVPLYEE